ncbi:MULTISPECIES: hypothetical protein [Aquitalea]|uniref:hypothetical protein n=1 Tax=Aquitalea TaxID=407217 RepID=UPI0013141162|nr:MULTISPECIES: hypothetical protein [Aquitalea]
MKYATPDIAVRDDSTGHACFCQPPRNDIVSDLIVFPAFFLAGYCPSGLGAGIVLKAD